MAFHRTLKSYLTLQEVAESFRVNERTVRRWIKSGDLPAFRVGHHWRIAESDLDAYLKRRRQT